MHPVIRVLAFLILVALLSRATLPFILCLDLLFMLIAFSHLPRLGAVIWRAVLRLRWLWLSLLLLYLLLPPVADTPTAWSFNLAGLWLGLERCLALLTVVLYFSLLNEVTDRTQLQAALYWLLAPLQTLGVPVARLCLRISLTLAAVSQLQQQFAGAGTQAAPARDWRQLPQRLEALFVHALAQAQQEPDPKTITLELTAPGVWQWLYLSVIGLLLLLGLRFFTV